MHYRRNFLSQVVFRIDYDPLPALLSTERSEFSERIKARFPVVIGHPTAQISINVGPAVSGFEQRVVGVQWEHRQEGGASWPLVSLSPNALTIEYGGAGYDHFPPFRADLELAIGAWTDLYKDAPIHRVGLRYVNEISFKEGHALDWQGILNEEIIRSTLAAIPEERKLARSVHQVHTFSNECTVLMTYGLINPDFPAEVVRRQFVIDIDCSRTGPLHGNEVMAIVDKLNATAEKTFEASIEDGLRQQMEIINE